VDPGQAGVSPEPLPCRARTVLASSPDERHYKQWHEGRGAETLYMRTWSAAELHAARAWIAPILSEGALEARFYDFGGVVRPLVATEAEVRSKWGTRQQAALQGQLIHRVLLLGQLIDTARESDAPPTSLFTWEPDDSSFRWASVVPISSYARHAIDCNVISKVEEMAAARTGSDGVLWGQLWERAVLRSLARGGAFTVRRAGDRQSPHSILELPPKKLVEVPGDWSLFERAVAAADGSQLLAPQAVNQPALDAADGPRRGFQATLSKDHGIKSLAKLIDMGPDALRGVPFRVYFVVPADMFDTFPRQRCDDDRDLVEQWVMRLGHEHASASPKSYTPAQSRSK
jgi:hypothetical protein